MRKDVSANASDGALLQPGVRAESGTVVAMEEPATVAAIGERAEEPEATRSPSSRTAAAGRACFIPAGKRRAWVITRRIGRIFFGDTCDRPGCYEGFERNRRSPLQRFCCHDCRRALERVLERERRWRERGQTQAGSLPARSWSLRL